MQHQILVGTSGWNYQDWKGRFYPDDLSSRRWLQHYGQTFETVEINNTFYHQPDHSTFDEWHRQVASDFVFAVKANRYLTHLRKLNNAEQPLQQFLDGARRLKKHLGPILYQLPPNWNKNLKRLRTFAKLLPTNLTHVIEFRNRDWLSDDTYAVLEESNLCLCIHDLLHRHPRRVTGPVVYVRFHGAGKKYGGNYRRRRLQRWADWIQTVAQERPVFAYFNNDIDGHAVRNALQLREMLGQSS